MNLLNRMAVAAVPGGVGAGALAALWQERARAVAACESDTIGACLGFGFPVLLAGPLLVTAAVWLALRATGVGPAPWAAALGALATAGGVLLQQAAHPRWTPPPVWQAVVLAVIGFALGVAVVTVALPPAVRVGLVVALLAPLAVFPLLRQETRRTGDREAFAELGLPLLVPQVPGYDIASAHADRADRVLSVTATRGRRWISVYVVDLPDDFAPPGRCGLAVADIVLRRQRNQPPASPGCRQVGPDHWTRVEPVGEVHLVRRGDALVLVSPGTDVPAADVEKAATTLTPVTPNRLAESGNP
ncbi:hypothetical protein [Micromonospora sp. NPDC049497]|uniref:hypothetical protein n=1 Tax=Micromonospora sp. NPDC049497 TaxID=3364273 RepID=UPI0037AD1F7B